MRPRSDRRAMCVYIFMHTCTHLSVYTYIHIHIYQCMCTQCVNVYYMMYTYTCLYMQTYMRTYKSQMQAYGAQKYHLVGNILQQSLLVVGASLIPISILWYGAANALTRLKLLKH